MAYAEVPAPEVQTWAQHAYHKGDYVILHDSYEYLRVDTSTASVMKKAELPLRRYRWHEVARPGRYEHITLEEAAAHVWGLESRLHRPAEHGVRGVHIGDNAAEVGASARGRSSTWRLNFYCRQACAVEIAGSLHPFRLWAPSADNPADRPSSFFGVRAGKRKHQPSSSDGSQQGHSSHQAKQSEIYPYVPRPLRTRVLTFVHMFSGKRRTGDLQYWLERLCAQRSICCYVWSFDVVINPTYNILDDAFFSCLRRWCWEGLIWGYHGGPVCATWSRARWRPGPGPPPLRDRSRPYGLPDLSPGNQQRCFEGSEMFLRHLDLKEGVLANQGTGTTEHPEDPRTEPYASIFNTPQMKRCLDVHGGEYVVLDQCMYGGSARKRTGWAGRLSRIQSLARKCNHRGAHAGSTSAILDSAGRFATKALEAYPSELCKALAVLFIDDFERHLNQAWVGPPPPPAGWVGAHGLTPAGAAVQHAPRASAAVWPIGRSDCVPLRAVACRHTDALPSRT